MTDINENNAPDTGSDVDYLIARMDRAYGDDDVSAAANLLDAKLAKLTSGSTDDSVTDDPVEASGDSDSDTSEAETAEGELSDGRQDEPSHEDNLLRQKEQSLQADYTRKMQDLAKQREETSKAKADYLAQAHFAVQMARGGQDQILKQWFDLGPEGRAKLAQEDPSTFVSFRQQVEERAAILQKMEHDLAAHHNEARKQTLEAESQKLLERIPEWKDTKVAQKEVQDLSRYLVSSVGFTPQEVEAASDSRYLVVARKAMLFDRMMAAQRDVATKKVTPKAKPTLKPGSGEVTPPANTAHREAMRKLRKTGRMDDAIAAIEARLSTLN